MQTTSQPRAKAGGEVGPNGEFYQGGKFIATQADTIKRAPMVHEVSAEELQRRAEANARQAQAVVQLSNWLAERAALLAPVLAVLEAPALDQWKQPIAGPESFAQSLGRQLRASGSVSQKQARCIARIIHGRETAKNTEQHQALIESLVIEFQTKVL